MKVRVIFGICLHIFADGNMKAFLVENEQMLNMVRMFRLPELHKMKLIVSKIFSEQW